MVTLLVLWHNTQGRVLYSHVLYHNDTIIKTHTGITDAMIKTQEDFFIKIFTSHFIARVQKGLLKVCMWEGAGDRTQLKYFDPKVILPSNSHTVIWTRLRNFFQYLATGMCHLRYLWNGLCDRHRAEITVMQFRGHSLPVCQSMRI